MEEKKNNNIQDSAEPHMVLIKEDTLLVDYLISTGNIDEEDFITFVPAKYRRVSGGYLQEILLPEKQSWIPIEKEPDVATILVAYKFGVTEAKYFQGKYWKDLAHEIPEVTHWQPLPSPPNK